MKRGEYLTKLEGVTGDWVKDVKYKTSRDKSRKSLEKDDSEFTDAHYEGDNIMIIGFDTQFLGHLITLVVYYIDIDKVFPL